MSSQFQVNLQVSANMDFYQEFYLAEADFTPLDITDMTFHSSIKKNASSVIANETTSTSIKQDYVSFETGVVDGVGGVYYLRLTTTESSKLEEGKYVYSTVMTNTENEFTEVCSGLVFVTVAFGIITNEEVVEEGDGTEIEPPDPDAGGGEGSNPGGTLFPGV